VEEGTAEVEGESEGVQLGCDDGARDGIDDGSVLVEGSRLGAAEADGTRDG